MKKKPAKPMSSLRQLQQGFVTMGKAVCQLQRRVSKLERKERVITGFADAVGHIVETEDED